MGLCEPSDCGRNARFGVVRGEACRRGELPLGRDAPAELLQPVEAAVRPPGEGRADPRVERAVALEDPRCRRALSTVVEHARPAQRRRLWIGAEAEVEQERRKSLPGLRHADRTALLTARL